MSWISLTDVSCELIRSLTAALSPLPGKSKRNEATPFLASSRASLTENRQVPVWCINPEFRMITHAELAIDLSGSLRMPLIGIGCPILTIFSNIDTLVLGLEPIGNGMQRILRQK